VAAVDPADPAGWLRAVMAVTIGLLAFLAIDATLEGSSSPARARRRSAARRSCCRCASLPSCC
jgi:hypothetical protein